MTCPTCDSPAATLIGRLGFLVWFRCRACGIDYSVRAKDVEPEMLQPIDEE